MATLSNLLDKMIEATNENTVGVGQLSEEIANKVSKTGITLDKHTDGLVYIFVSGKPVGNGVELGTVVEGDIIGNFDENNNILLSGDISVGTYTLAYMDEKGNLTGTGSLVVSEIEPEPEPDEPTITNLIPLSTNADGTPYNGGKGYKTGYKISVSGGGESSSSDTEITGFMPVGYDDTMYFKGITFAGSGTNDNYCFYDSNKNRIAGGNWYLVFKTAVNGEVVSAEIKNMTLNQVVGDINNVAFIRISASVIDDNSIITVNQPIV